MRNTLLVARRDYMETVRAKGFLIGMIVAPIGFAAIVAGIAFIGNQAIKDQRIAIVDRSGVAAGPIIAAAEKQNQRDMIDKATGKQIMARYIFENIPPQPDAAAQRLTLSERVRKGELATFVEIGEQVVRGGGEPLPRSEPLCAVPDLCPALPVERTVTYFGASGLQGRGWLNGQIINAIRGVRLQQAGLGPEQSGTILSDVTFETMNLVTRDEAGQIQAPRPVNPIEGFAIPFGLVFILMMVVIVGSSPLLSAIAQDKMERVFEMMLVSSTPLQLMGGKVLAALGLSLTSSIFYVLAGILSLQAMALVGLVPFTLLPWFFAYLITSVLMLAALGAGLGAACATPQDAQNLAGFLVFPVVIPAMLMPAIMQAPNSTMATVMSFFPPFTSMLMLLRQAMPTPIPAWQPWAGLAGMLLFTVFVVWGASRIFRIGILMQGKPPHLGELLRWALKG